MEQSADLAAMLENLICPAFVVRNGVITELNRSAMQRQIQRNIHVSDLICIGAEEYANFTNGKLCLTLCICDVHYNTSVVTFNDDHIFLLESDYEMPELRALSLAAQLLKEPLSNAMAGLGLLSPHPAIQKDDQATAQLAQINRSLHQMLRSVTNMSDAVYYSSKQNIHLQSIDIIWVFDEILQKAAEYAKLANRKLEFKLPNISVETLADQEKLERAVLNLISNAIKYSAVGSVIHTELIVGKKSVRFIIENPSSEMDPSLRGNFFSQYLREPGLDNSNSGIGLGLPIVRSVAAIHSGTVLMQATKEDTIRITMSIAIEKQCIQPVLNSPLTPITDYAGGHDRTMLELSESLPYPIYKP